jgi:hypothetical protein
MEFMLSGVERWELIVEANMKKDLSKTTCWEINQRLV